MLRSSTVLHINQVQPTIPWLALTKGLCSKRHISIIYGGQFTSTTQVINPKLCVAVCIDLIECILTEL